MTAGQARVVDVAIVGGGVAGAGDRRLPRAGRPRRGRRSSARRRGAGGPAACSPRPAAVRGAAPRRASTRRRSIGSRAPIPAMRVESPRGHGVPADLRRGDGRRHARSGFDRSALDPALLALAGRAGATVRLGAVRATVELARAGRACAAHDRRTDAGEPSTARVVVGADGPRSIVARGRGRRPLAARSAGRVGPDAGTSRTTPVDRAEGRAHGRAPRRRVLRDRARPRRTGQHRHRARGSDLADRALARVGRRGDDGAALLARIPSLPGRPGGVAHGARSPTRSRARARSGSRVARRAGPGWLGRRRRGRVPRPVHRRGAPPGARLGAAGRGARSTPSSRGDGAGRRLGAYDARDAPAVREQGPRLARRPGVPRPAGAVRAGRAALARARCRPCDDGPRDGRPRPRVPRPRPAVPRRAPRGRERPAGVAPRSARTAPSSGSGSPPTRGVERGRRRPARAGSRRATSGAGQWTLPGGGLDFGEDPVAGRPARARRGDGPRRPRRRRSLGIRSAVLEPDETTSGHRIHVRRQSLYRVDGHRRRAARRARRLDRPRRVGPVRGGRRAAGSSTVVAWARAHGRAAECARPSASTSRRRRSSSTGSPATSPAGSGCSPTTRAPRVVRRDADGVLVCDFVARRPFVPWLGLGHPGHLAQPDLARAGDPPAAVRPRGRRHEGHGRDLDDRAAPARRSDGTRVEIEPRLPPRACPGFAAFVDRRVHAPDRRAGRWPRSGPRRGARDVRRGAGRRTPDMADDPPRPAPCRRSPGIGVHLGVGIGLPAFRAGLRAAASPGQAHRPLRPVAVPVAGRGAGRRLRAARPHGRPGGPRRSTGSASSASRPGGWRWPTPASCRASAGAPDGERIGIYLGSALGGIAFAESAAREVPRARPAIGVPHPRARGVRRGRAGQPRHRARRPRADPVDGQLVRVAARSRSARRSSAIRAGEIDAAIAGGVECPAVAARVRRVRPHPGPGPRPQRRPGRTPRGRWTRARDGFVMGEGAALLVLEAAEVAGARGARPYAEVLGYARHVGRPPHGPAARRRPRGGRARSRSRSPTPASRADEIDWVSAHASSTPIGDIAEARAIAAGARRPRRDRAGERDEGAHRPSAGRDGRDRGRDGARSPSATAGCPGRRTSRRPSPSSPRSCPASCATAARVATAGSCRPRSASAASTRRSSSGRARRA